MKLSIIVPAYNSEMSVQRCVWSIVSQNYEDYEIVLVDDHSSDNTLKICMELQKDNPNIIIVQAGGKGVSNARNTGLFYASGDIIGFCDADDYFEPNAFDKVIDAFKNNCRPDVVVTGYYSVSANLLSKKAFRLKKTHYCHSLELMSLVLNDNNIMGSVWNKFFKVELINNIKFDPKLSYCEDMHFAMKVLSENQNCSCMILNESLYNYVENENSVTHNVKQLFDADGNLKYIVSMKAICRDCALNAQLKSEVGFRVASFAADTIFTCNPQGKCRDNLRNEISNDWMDFLKNIHKFQKIQNLKRLIKIIYILMVDPYIHCAWKRKKNR